MFVAEAVVVGVGSLGVGAEHEGGAAGGADGGNGIGIGVEDALAGELIYVWGLDGGGSVAG